MKTTLVVHRCVLSFSLLALTACAHKSVSPVGAEETQSRVSELQGTVRNQNRIIQDLKTQLLVLEAPKAKNSTRSKNGLSGVSLAAEENDQPIALAPEPSKTVKETDPIKIYEASISLLEQGERDLAFNGFSRLVKDFRSHPLSDNAYFETGKIYVQKGEIERAVFHFKQMPILYPSGDRIAEGQLILADLLERLGRNEESQKILSSIADQFSGSATATKAKQKISKLDTKG